MLDWLCICILFSYAARESPKYEPYKRYPFLSLKKLYSVLYCSFVVQNECCKLLTSMHLYVNFCLIWQTCFFFFFFSDLAPHRAHIQDQGRDHQNLGLWNSSPALEQTVTKKVVLFRGLHSQQTPNLQLKNGLLSVNLLSVRPHGRCLSFSLWLALFLTVVGNKLAVLLGIL